MTAPTKPGQLGQRERDAEATIDVRFAVHAARARGRTQRSIAKAAGTDDTYLSSAMRGRIDLPAPLCARIIAASTGDLDYLEEEAGFFHWCAAPPEHLVGRVVAATGLPRWAVETIVNRVYETKNKEGNDYYDRPA